MALPDLNRSLIRTATVWVSPGVQVAFYKFASTEALATLMTAGFFNFARNYLKPSDRIQIVSEIDDAPNSDTATLKLLTVPATGNVTVANASGTTALTDNSTGTSGGDTIAAVTDVATAADAIATLAAKINQLVG